MPQKLWSACLKVLCITIGSKERARGKRVETEEKHGGKKKLFGEMDPGERFATEFLFWFTLYFLLLVTSGHFNLT